jgi:hypothetical protein
VTGLTDQAGLGPEKHTTAGKASGPWPPRPAGRPRLRSPDPHQSGFRCAAAARPPARRERLPGPSRAEPAPAPFRWRPGGLPPFSKPRLRPASRAICEVTAVSAVNLQLAGGAAARYARCLPLLLPSALRFARNRSSGRSARPSAVKVAPPGANAPRPGAGTARAVREEPRGRRWRGHESSTGRPAVVHPTYGHPAATAKPEPGGSRRLRGPYRRELIIFLLATALDAVVTVAVPLLPGGSSSAIELKQTEVVLGVAVGWRAGAVRRSARRRPRWYSARVAGA